MYLHTGSGAVVDIKDIITIIDIDVFKKNHNAGLKAKSVIVTSSNNFFSSLSSAALSRRMQEAIGIFYTE